MVETVVIKDVINPTNVLISYVVQRLRYNQGYNKFNKCMLFMIEAYLEMVRDEQSL